MHSSVKTTRNWTERETQFYLGTPPGGGRVGWAELLETTQHKTYDTNSTEKTQERPRTIVRSLNLQLCRVLLSAPVPPPEETEGHNHAVANLFQQRATLSSSGQSRPSWLELKNLQQKARRDLVRLELPRRVWEEVLHGEGEPEPQKGNDGRGSRKTEKVQLGTFGRRLINIHVLHNNPV